MSLTGEAQGNEREVHCRSLAVPLAAFGAGGGCSWGVLAEIEKLTASPGRIRNFEGEKS